MGNVHFGITESEGTVLERVDVDGVRHYNVEGKLLPSVTEVLSTIRDPGLETWQIEYSVKQGNIHGAEEYGQLHSDYGTRVHELISLQQDAEFFEPTPVRRAMESWKQLRNDWDFEIIDQEYVVHGEKYAGTVDLLVRSKQERIQFELKTSSALRERAAIQAEAYFRADGRADKVVVIRLGKNKVEYEIHEPDHEIAWAKFQAALVLFDSTSVWESNPGYAYGKKPQELEDLREFA